MYDMILIRISLVLVASLFLANCTTSIEAPHPALYPNDSSLSPLTPFVVNNLRQIASRSDFSENVFAKVGASDTVNSNFLRCFSSSVIDLDSHKELQSTIDFFNAGNAGGETPFVRRSLAANVGWNVGRILSGNPSALEEEVAALSPRFAIVLIGTNDIQLGNIFRYAEGMLTLTDELTSQGIIPLLTTIPPRDDDLAVGAWVPRYNAVIRAIAQGKQLPFIDLHRELVSLPNHGIGFDGIHMNVFLNGGCIFTSEALQFGLNTRNLLTITMLDRLKSVLVDNEDAPVQTAPARKGNGSLEKPFEIEGFPFVESGDTSLSGSSLIDHYSGCGATQDESGNEQYYHLVLTEPKKVKAMVFSYSQVDIDLHLLDSSASSQGCIERAHQTLMLELEPGEYYFSLDTFVGSDGIARSGEYYFILLEE